MGRVDESFRFIPSGKRVLSEKLKDEIGETSTEDKVDSDKIMTKNKNNINNLSTASLKHQEQYKKRPPKKRLLATSVDTLKNSSNQKRAKSESGKQGPNASETEKSVVESL